MKKKMLSFWIALLLLALTLPASAELIDVRGTKYEHAVKLLSDLGVLTGASSVYFEPKETATRSNAAMVIAAVCGVQEMDASEVFSDVPKSHPAFSAVSLVYQLGIVSGTGDGQFSPDAPITGEQMAKILVCLAGYRAHAEAMGGYPSGYLTKANQLGILKNVSMEQTLTKGALALMLYNTLLTVPAEPEFYGSNAGTYVEEGENLLARNLHVYEVRGMVTANMATAIAGTVTRHGEVAIDGERYLEKHSIATKIGRRIVAYYKYTDTDEKEIVSFRDAEDTETITLSAADILPDTTTTTFVYQRKEDEQQVRRSISPNAAVLYNGGAVTLQSAVLRPAQGTVTLTETGDSISVICVNEYEDAIVSNVNTETGVLYFKENPNGTIHNLNFEDSEICLTAEDATGSPFSLAQCKGGTVLSVMKSQDGKVCTVIVSNEKLIGTVTEKTDNTISIDGKVCHFSKNYYGMMPEVGEQVQLSINYLGEAVTSSKDITSRKYGYLMAAAFEGKGLSQIAKIKILTKDNKIEVFSAAKRIAVNDIVIGSDKLFNPEAVLSASENGAVFEIYRNGAAVEQLIVYEQNEVCEITSITTAKNRVDDSVRDQDVFALQAEADSGMFIGHGLRTFFTKYRVLDSTVVFAVPEHYTGDNDKLYSAMPGTAVQHSTTYPGLKLYDLNEENVAGAMVTQMDMTNAEDMYNSKAVLVKSVTTTTDEDGMACEALHVIDSTGIERVIYNPDGVEAIMDGTAISDPSLDPTAVDGALPAKILVSELETGDVIKYKAVGDVLSNVMVCFRVGSPKELEVAYEGTVQKWPYSTNDYYQNLWVYAPVTYAGEEAIRFYTTIRNGTTVERIHTYGDAAILIFNKDKQTVTKGSKSSFMSGDYFFASRQNSFEHLMVIYR